MTNKFLNTKFKLIKVIVDAFANVNPTKALPLTILFNIAESLGLELDVNLEEQFRECCQQAIDNLNNKISNSKIEALKSLIGNIERNFDEVGFGNFDEELYLSSKNTFIEFGEHLTQKDFKELIELFKFELQKQLCTMPELSRFFTTQNIQDILKEIKSLDFNEELKKIYVYLERFSKLLEEEQSVFTIDEVDKKLRNETRNPSIGLNYFEVDDQDFIDNFKKIIDQDIVYVHGASKEETAYCVLHQLSVMSINKKILFVTSKKGWDRLKFQSIKDRIVIRFFDSDSTSAIDNNINIFIINEAESHDIKNKLLLRRRTKITLEKCLKDSGLSVEDTHNLIMQTNGLYFIIKRKIFKGTLKSKWNFNNDTIKVFVASLLCGKWTESEGDKLVIEELSGISYSEFKSVLIKYINCENPFLVEVIDSRETIYKLASFEYAWDELRKYITNDIWDMFLDTLENILTEIDPIFESPIEKHFELSWLSKKPEWSSTLKAGMLTSLIIYTCYNESNEQNKTDKFVKEVLQSITDLNKWAYISTFFQDLCEASPNEILNRLEKELIESTGMIELFKVKDEDFFTAKNYYTGVLFAIEQLLLKKEYVFRIIDWLWQIDAYNFNYNLTNSPGNLLRDIFCTWYNISILTVEEKIKMLKKAIIKYDNAWEVVYENLAGNRSVITSTRSKFKYRITDNVENDLYEDQVNKLYVEYFKICLEHTNIDAERWIKLIIVLHNYYEDVIVQAFKVLEAKIHTMADDNKIKIKNKIREEIYRNRYFNNSDWAMPENKTYKFEEMLNKINCKNQVYEYLYLYKSHWNFLLLNPSPYKKEEDFNINKNYNDKLKEEEIRVKTKEITLNNLNLRELLLKCDSEETTIGTYIAKYYFEDMQFEENIFTLMIEVNPKSRIAFDYAKVFIDSNSDTSILNNIIKIAKEKGAKSNLIVNLLRLEVFREGNAPLITLESEELKVEYWNSPLLNISNKHSQFILWAVSECKKYGNINSYLELLFSFKNSVQIKTSDLYDALISVEDINMGKSISVDEYYLTELLKVIQEEYMYNITKCEKIARIEFIFNRYLEFENMSCFSYLIKSNPDLYAQFINFIYKKDNGELNENATQDSNYYQTIFSLFYKAHFCPADIDGKVNFKDLKSWIDNFRLLLVKQNQISLFSKIVGRLLPYSPIGDDGYMPCEAVRELIELIYDEELKNSYCISEHNKRGAYTPNAGISEKNMAKKYKDNADNIRSDYSKTATIYDDLSRSYTQKSKFERRRAEDFYY